MPRLFVKNLPSKITEDKFRRVFQEFGNVTDCTLKYSKDGTFRKFGFVGFKTEEEAQAAISHLNKSYLQQSRIEVQLAVSSLSDKPKPRGRHSFGSAEKPSSVEEEKTKEKTKKKKKSTKENKANDDPVRQEFMALHNIKLNKKGGEAMDTDSSSEDNEDAASDVESDKSVEEKKVFFDVQKKGQSKAQVKQEKMQTKKKAEPTRFVLKMRRLFGKYDEKKIMDFFKPLVPVTVRLPRNARHRLIGVAYVSFKDEGDLEQALRKNKNFINGKQVLLKKGVGADITEAAASVRPWEAKGEISPDVISDTGRLYLRNLPYKCTEDDLESLFKPFGPLTEVNLPFDKAQNRVRGYAFITFMLPEDAVKAYMKLDGTDFQGRLLHILPGKEKVDKSEEPLTFKEKKKKLLAGSSHNWNALFIGTSAVTDLVAENLKMDREKLLDMKDEEGLAVKLALGETDIVKATRKFLLDNGVALDSFSQAAGEKSKTTILVKDLPAHTTEKNLRDLFGKFGQLSRVLVPPSGVTAIVEFALPNDARTAFRKLVGIQYRDRPLYLQWAPVNTFFRPAEPSSKDKEDEEAMEEEDVSSEDSDSDDSDDSEDEDEDEDEEGEEEQEEKEGSESSESEVEPEADDSEKNDKAGNTVFVKNLNFDTKDEELQEKFKSCGDIVSATIVKKPNVNKPGKLLSAGYGFVTFTSKAGADKALKDLQHCMLDGHCLELSRSQKTAVNVNVSQRKKQVAKKQNNSTKILVRNVPFQATQKELTQIFRKFGTLNFVRLPKKIAGTGKHRGFAFVDFTTKEAAKNAFKALCHSTHLYGRRLVLEWANAEETVEDLQRKTARKYHSEGPRKKLKKSDVLSSIG